MDYKQIKRIPRHLAARVTLKFAFSAAKFLPLESIYPIGDFIGEFSFLLAARHRKLALKNLSIAFKDRLPEQKKIEIARENFRNIAKSALELLRFQKHDIVERVSICGKENLDAALRDRGVIGLTAHFGNFPLLGLRLAQEGYRIAFVARKMRDEKLDEYIAEKRKQSGLDTIISYPRKGCVENCLAWLKKNGHILLIHIDQSLDSRTSVQARFFDTPVSTPAGPVVLSLRTKARILPIFILRNSRGRHKILIDKPVDLRDCGDFKETLQENTERLNQLLESYINRYPKEWSWLGRRWRGQYQTNL
jgi:KDO2-lipid IV(A) lauroyltransferase